MEKHLYRLTCDCYEPPARQNVVVLASSIDDALVKAKKRMSGYLKVKTININIAAVERLESK